MDWVNELAEKAAAVRVRALKAPRPALPRLLAAKRESDRRNYAAKASIIRQLIAESPDDFVVDSEEGGVVGLTHAPTGFRVHMPRTAVPRPHLLRRAVVVGRPRKAGLS